MRHRVKGKKLSRKTAHRKETLRSLSNALIKEHRIVTTLAKAKALRPYFEPLVTRAKEDNQHNRRQVYSKLNDKETVSKLFDEIGPKAKDRPGGYTRIVRYGYRDGDGAEMAIIELVDYNDIKPEQDREKRKKTRRAGRSKKTTSAQPDKDQEQKNESEDQKEVTETEPEEKTESQQDETVEEEAAEGESAEVQEEKADAEAQQEGDTEETSDADKADSEEDHTSASSQDKEESEAEEKDEEEDKKDNN